MKDKIKGMIIIIELLLLIFVSLFSLSQYINLKDYDFYTNITGGFNSGFNPPNVNISSDIVTGKAPLKVSFNVDVQEDDNWIIYSYYWDFGDGHTSFEKNPTHIYQNYGFYIIYLNITYENGKKTQKQLEIDVLRNKYPRATAWVTGTVGGAPTRVYFHGKGTDVDGTIVSYKWSGAVTGNTPEVSKYFSRSGYYSATFTVTDDNGDSDSAKVDFWLDERWESDIISMLLKPIHRWFNN